MNILLTGASGFVGNYFKNTYTKKYNIQTFSFLNNNFNDLDLHFLDTIVHLSALVHQMGGASKEEYNRINVLQTLELAKKAKDSGVGHFIFMSSVKVYGEETNIAYCENSVCQPQDEYGRSKFKAENELRILESDDFKVSIIRTPIVYGYGVKANIKNLIKLVQNVPILPFGKIRNKRSMVYVGNLCHLIDEIIIQEKNGIFLASDSEPLSTTKLCNLIAINLNKKVYLIKIPFFEIIVKKFKPNLHKRLFKSLEIDNLKTIEKLNLKNPYTIEEGVKYMIQGEKKDDKII